MFEVETVRIEHPDLEYGMVINRADFDPEKHVVFGTVPVEPEKSEGATGAS